MLPRRPFLCHLAPGEHTRGKASAYPSACPSSNHEDQKSTMNLLKEVFTHEVYPALGCTEPISCAFAAATAAA